VSFWTVPNRCLSARSSIEFWWTPLGRNPEIKWRLQPSDLMGLHRKQVALLRNALQCLRPGGRLVYATCSLEEEENRMVIQALPGDWQVTERLPGVDEGDGFFVAVLTSELLRNG
jgi:16S rRNA (cytosine967-C5)-methyltransferase